MPATIHINKLELSTLIGIYAFERRLKQKLFVSAQFEVESSKIAKNDDIGKAVDYEKVSETIIAFGEKNDFYLLETFAEKLAALLLKNYALKWIKLEVTKPGALKNAQDVSIALCRPSPLPV